MSENKRRLNPWIFIVILGVIAILFSVFAVQSQSELNNAQTELKNVQEENQKLKAELDATAAEALKQHKLAEMEALAALQAREDCMKSNKRK